MTKHIKWTTPKLARLKIFYPVMSLTELMHEFHPHSENSIRGAANRLGLRKRRDWNAIVKAHVPAFTFGASQ